MRRGASAGIRTPVAFCALLLLAACGNAGTVEQVPGVRPPVAEADPARAPALRPGDVLSLRLLAGDVPARFATPDRPAGGRAWTFLGTGRTEREGDPALRVVANPLPQRGTWRIALGPEVGWEPLRNVVEFAGWECRVVFEMPGITARPHPRPGCPEVTTRDGSWRVFVKLRVRDGERYLTYAATGADLVPPGGCRADGLPRRGRFVGWEGPGLDALRARVRDLGECAWEVDLDAVTVHLDASGSRGVRPKAVDVLRVREAILDLGVGHVAVGEEVEGSPGRRSERSAVEDALHWLRAHAHASGGWGAAAFAGTCDGKPLEPPLTGAGDPTWDLGATALALQAYMAAGYTNRGRNPFAKTISKALRRLKRVQGVDGCFGDRGAEAMPRTHAFCTRAVVEIYGMTGSPIFKSTALRALDFLPTAWRAGRDDPLAHAWTISALWMARLINTDAEKRGKRPPLPNVPPLAEELHLAARLLPPEHDSTSLYCRVLLGDNPRDEPVIGDLASRVAARAPPGGSEAVARDPWISYLSTAGLFEVGGDLSRAWSRAEWARLRERQRPDGGWCCYRGSWDPEGEAIQPGGRVAATALNAMTLAIYYRSYRHHNVR